MTSVKSELSGIPLWTSTPTVDQCQTLSPKTIHVSNIQTEQAVFGNIYMYICMQYEVFFLSPEFEGELGGVHGRAYREERER